MPVAPGAAALGLAVTAEGVETADQVARLQALGALLAGGRGCSPLAGLAADEERA